MAFKRSDCLPPTGINSEAIVTAQTALSSNYCFQNKMENYIFDHGTI
jgi:hypothetical protein